MVTAIIGKDHYRTELIASGKTIIADEPEEVGGTNTGPAPGEFLMISLASCTAITLRMYADRKKWAVGKIKVEVSFEKAEFKTIFIREIYLEGNLSADERQKLLEIAEKCPVHKTLSNPIEIETKLGVK
ncbi:MAG: OsmC family protein [Cyclobacteriaceae bacterium]|jgi:putative redox protein|nr:OsmC family protein [Cyclobacteriaceae bacterium]